MSKLSYKGIIIGSISDIILTNLFTIPLLIYVIYHMGSTELPTADALLKELKNNSFYNTIAFLIGSVCSIIGGYIAARIAKSNELLNGTLASFLCVGMGIYSILSGTSKYTLTIHLLIVLLTIALSFLGGYLRFRQTKNSKI